MATKRAFVRQVEGLSFVARADSNHWVSMDGLPEFGGHDGGSRPKELLLMALGGCTASDVVSILKKKRAPVERVDIHLTADQADEHPQVFTKIHVEYVVFGDGIKPADVERAIELSETKYCSVSAMLRPAIEITHSYRLQSAAVAA